VIETSALRPFTMRGPTTVSYATATFANGGKAADLAVGLSIKMSGHLSQDGTYVIADQITIH